MSKKIIKATVISATVGAAVGAATVVLTQKENRKKAIKVLNDAKEIALDSANGLSKKRSLPVLKTKKTSAKKATKKNGRS